MISWTIYFSFIGAALMWALPLRRVRAQRQWALAVSLAGLAVSVVSAAMYKIGAGGETLQFSTRVPWIPSLGIEYHLGADGISVLLVLLTGIASVAGVLFSWNLEHRTREYFSLYLLLIGAVYGVFLSCDLFLLFAFYELAIIPKYFLIAIWGSTRKEYGAMKLVLYSFFGSALVLIGLIAVYVQSGAATFNLIDLIQFPFPDAFQKWVFPLLFFGFAVLAGIWPFHTWAPTGHVAAPTPASMLLAGVVMKLGAYGCLRVAMTLMPAGMAAWRTEIVWLGVIGIVYGALVSMVQRDFKFVIGYSSVSHMGFVILGLAALNETSVSGAVYQMFSHGILAALLFAVVGRMVYDRTHERDLGQLSHWRLSRSLPFAAVTFVIAGFASVGLPGFSGFIAELQVLLGAWQYNPTVAVIAGAGILLAACYTLNAMNKAFFSEEASTTPTPVLAPISIPERLGTALLLAATLGAGLFPSWFLNFIQPSLQSPWMRSIFKGAGWP